MTSGPAPRITLSAVLDAFDRRDRFEPLTTTEIAEDLGCARRTAYNKLRRLADGERLRTKKVGARGRVWWRPRASDERPELDRITDAFLAIDGDCRISYLNERASDLLERSVESLLGECVWDAFPEAVESTFRRESERAMRTRESVSFDGYFPPLDAWFSVRVYPSETGLSVYFRDVTEQKERLRALERFRAIAQSASDVILTVDETSRIDYVTPAVEDTLGFARAELVGESLTNLASEEMSTRRLEGLQRNLRTGDRSLENYHELPVKHRDGHEVTLGISFVEFRDGGERRFAGLLRDITARQRRERELERYETIVETLWDGVYALDDDDRFVFVNEAFCAMTDYDESELLGSPASLVHSETLSATARTLAAEVDADERAVAIVEFDLRRADGTTCPVETRFGPYAYGRDRGRTGVVRDIAERRRFERTLTALHGATCDLLCAATKTDVCRTVVDAVTRILDLSGAAVYLYDGALSPETVSGEFGGPAAFPRITPRDGGLAWHVYETNETCALDDLRGVDRPTHQPETMRSGLFVPLGDHGVVVAGATETGTFDGDVQRLMELLAVTAEAALDRVERETKLREREREIRQRRDELARFNRTTTLVQGAIRGVVESTTRDQIERTLCDRFAAADDLRFAWIGEVNATRNTVDPSTWAGDGDAPSTVRLGDGDGDGVAAGSGARPTVRAARTHEVVVARRGEADWPAASDDRAVIAVPLVHEDRLYGVLTVASTRDAGTDARERRLLGELGAVVGHAISAIERRDALLSDDVVALEFQSAALAEPFLRAAEDSDSFRISLDRAIPVDGMSHIHYYTATGIRPDRFVAGLKTHDEIREARIISRQGDTCRAEVRTVGRTFGTLFAAYGGRTRMTSVEGGHLRMVADLPQTVDVRKVVEAASRMYPDLELLSQRTVQRPTRHPEEFRALVGAQLTDRQRTALEVAYYAGFFEWPRESTGEELAEAMDISAPTFHKHLRMGEKKAFRTLVEEEDAV